MSQLLALDIADSPDTWTALGFAVADDVARVGGVAIRLLGAEARGAVGDGRGITAWAIAGVDHAIDGLPAAPEPDGASEAAHPNGISSIDHVVVSTPDFDRTIAAFEAAGIPLKRVRETGRSRQAFFRLGSVIAELVGGPPGGDGPARFWGIAFTAADLDATIAFLGDRVHTAKDAVQAGRRIATIDRAAGLSLGVAIMSAEPARQR